MFRLRGLVLFAAILLAAPSPACGSTDVTESGARLAGLFRDLPVEWTPSGILYDRILPLSRIADLDGADSSPSATPADWRQIYDELRRASLSPPTWPPLQEVLHRAESPGRRGPIPIAVLDFRYERIRPAALEGGSLVASADRLAIGSGNPFVSRRAVVATALRDGTYHGAQVVFRLAADHYYTNCGAPPASLEIDFDCGQGFQSVRFGSEPVVSYDAPGRKTIRIRIAHAGEPDRFETSFFFEVRALRTPAPHDTWQIEAAIPYQGAVATGEAYLHLADDHETLTDPVVLIEGFDLDNSMGWDELYELLNREELLETLRAHGFDAVVLNFTDATEYVQRNAFVAVELLRQIQAAIEPGRSIALAGASMGGLIGRYALAYMETHALEHSVRNFISFDGSQRGADIPLGLQYWVWFFADDSPDAAALLAALDSPAARQLLLYHYSDPPSEIPTSDPLRTELDADLAAIGDYPQETRKVAIANGSSTQLDQGFAAGDQIIRWEYTSFLVDIIGNVWAVPDATSQQIFHGLIDIILLPSDEVHVLVSETQPLDNAPGGWRGSMAQLDTTEAPYGDIEALHPNHCFIPSTSALALETDDLFYDIAGDPDLLALTPFDAVYFPPENQEHVEITPENAEWILAEVAYGAGSVPEPPGRAIPVARIEMASLASLSGALRILYTVPASGAARVGVYDAQGREVAQLHEGQREAGTWETHWDGRGPGGQRVASGVYFVALRGAEYAAARRLVLP